MAEYRAYFETREEEFKYIARARGIQEGTKLYTEFRANYLNGCHTELGRSSEKRDDGNDYSLRLIAAKVKAGI